ncbi:hypothetical protein [uncultured Methanobrevibacter sp.]|uniref:hypothetical protein n=1 Tax=uncultured Methanobrevibacter sp. TaxID=253161 RepID=UPI00260C674D|nr:hypothetical protein [uncultured Methanobrevibacter sp.]
MISVNKLKNIAHKLHLDEVLESHKELWRDNRGGFLIPATAKIRDLEYERYRHLPVNWDLSPVTNEHLPDEFSQKAVNTIDMFRRKTYDLKCECLIYFDIQTGNIVSCNFSDDEPNEVNAVIYSKCLKGMHIASIHNHPHQYYSPPSGKNFEMLGKEFEEYELISTKNELWILESKEIVFSDEVIQDIRNNADESFESYLRETNVELEKGHQVIDNVDRDYGIYLLNYLNNEFENIKLRKVNLNE